MRRSMKENQEIDSSFSCICNSNNNNNNNRNVIDTSYCCGLGCKLSKTGCNILYDIFNIYDNHVSYLDKESS